MALDAATLALAGGELKATLADARIDKIFEPTRDEVVLNLRTRADNYRLLLSARSGSARACLTRESFENPAVPPSFCMLLRKHFTGGRLLDVRTIPDERILFFDFQCTSELGDTVVNTLAAELMGRYSNLVLIQKENAAFPERAGKIIDALKRVDFEDSELRQLLPGLRYQLPPKPDRLSFFGTSAPGLVAALADLEMPVSKALTKCTGGAGPVVCREAAYRAFGPAEPDACAMTPEQKQVLARALDEIKALYAAGGTPVLAVAEGRPVEFSFLPLTQYGPEAELRTFGSYSELLEGYYAAKDKAERLRQKSRELAKTVRNLHERAVRKAAARREEQAESAASDTLRVYGELLSANLWAVPKGAKEVTLTNYYDGQPVTIPLDVRLTPSANAQKYFKEYKKKQTAARLLTQLIAESDAEAAYLATVQYEVEAAQGEAALNEIRAELKAQGYLKYFKFKDKKQKPADFLRYRSSDGFAILVGRNNVQNDRLTLKTARGRDVWFHVKNAPGSHAVVLCEGRDVPDRTKTEAAMLAAYHSSQYSPEGGAVKVAVDYTEVKNVWKANGAKPGMVLYDPYETAYVTPDAAFLQALRENEASCTK